MSKENISSGEHKSLASNLVDKLVKEDSLDVSAAMHREMQTRIVNLLDSLKADFKVNAINSLDEVPRQSKPGSLTTLVNLTDIKDKINKL